MIVFFDTETTGLPKDWKAPVIDVDNWPRVIQLAWLVTDIDGNEISKAEELIQPDGWEVPVGDFWIEHGFDTATSMENGNPIADVVARFMNDLNGAEFLVSHNMDFDQKVLGAEFIRLGVKSENQPTKICTKEAATDFCKIPFSGKVDTRPWVKKRYKWPKLEELHVKLFGHDFENKHQAGGDVAALRNCFFELIQRNVIQLERKSTT
jgi:DNA polymerase-3 subunit epsilon